jgi:hypothetical protein
VTWITAGYGANLYGHELGHNFGNHHASFVNCGSVPIADSGCTVFEYGDIYDMMGLSNGYFDAMHKEALSWLSGTQIQTVTSDGVYQLIPIESQVPSLKALKIQRKTNDYLYVEYRQPIGSDINFPVNSNVFTGALLRTIAPDNDVKSYLIDPTPAADVLSSALTVGSTFTDPASNTTVKVLSRNSETLSVEVHLGQTDFTAPQVQITSPANGDTVPLSTTLSATASDNVAVTKVEFRRLVGIGQNGYLGTVTSAPYNLDVTFPMTGAHSIYAKAYDAAGNVTQTSFMQINVTENPQAVCGDVNGDGLVDVSDVVALIGYIFNGGSINNLSVADVNGDGLVDISDVVHLITYIFNGGSAPQCTVK